MSIKNPLLNSLIALTGDRNVITVHKSVVRFTGSIQSAMLLEQLLYWTPRGKIGGGWVAKSDEEFAEELSLSRYAIRKARADLIAMGFLETKVRRFKGSPTTHYRIDSEALSLAWETFLAEAPDLPKPNSGYDESKETTESNRKLDSSESNDAFFDSSDSLTETSQRPEQKTAQSLQTDSLPVEMAEEREVVKVLLQEQGIGEPKLSELLALPKMTIPFTERAISKWKGLGKSPGYLVGMLARMPPIETDAERRRKYVDNPYSDFIES